MAMLGSPIQIIASTPIVTRVWTAATVGLSLIYLWVQWTSSVPYPLPYFTLIPGESYVFPWSLLTAALVETSIIELLVTLVVVPPSLRYLERLWGAIETIKFISFTIVLSNVIAFCFNWIEFIVTRNADYFLFGMEYHGQMALQTGILVAFTQLIPEHQVQVLGIIKARVKALPMAYLGFSTIICLLGFQSPYILIQFGFFFAFLWLRFYKKNAADSLGGYTYGDRSETFAFVYWFPPFVQPFLRPVFDTVYNHASRLHWIPVSSVDVEANNFAPGGARAEAERRRQMALKALDQRVANSSSPANGASASKPASRAEPSGQHEESDIATSSS